MALKPTLAGYPSAMWADTGLSALVLVPLAEKILTGLSACFSLMGNLAQPSPVLEVPSKSRWGAHAKRGRRQQQGEKGLGNRGPRVCKVHEEWREQGNMYEVHAYIHPYMVHTYVRTMWESATRANED
ncbi:hypothetical protein GE21DRAFT_9400 [Neurospora crassa]|uniref:Uncharacterized protein n=1 Tax=Neurospora crassa (strain ATCC 24698 / 74-OR23-1A / CBS 708.71 / DSM 1257 / FGSC 987) TaxID=367110 RepID=Q7S2D1_NEUCR|nr:hypothetical protein NCU05947 [Neurospora crassa OR74A]EAA29555.1 hypothetical protein NCU05947 [Neurospora crassa OR74A]KHE87527.1 hypothetical protein GE21DRAFT_9400 [Neurospora crassa]|eukprot:XP_958791.1 hypothetical protein NCU05947 [Neurospora crassa OR74A]